MSRTLAYIQTQKAAPQDSSFIFISKSAEHTESSSRLQHYRAPGTLASRARSWGSGPFATLVQLLASLGSGGSVAGAGSGAGPRSCAGAAARGAGAEEEAAPERLAVVKDQQEAQQEGGRTWN